MKPLEKRVFTSKAGEKLVRQTEKAVQKGTEQLDRNGKVSKMAGKPASARF